MNEYKLSLLGKEHLLISCEDEREAQSENEIILSPSITADIRVSATMASISAAVLLAAHFLIDVRGLPLDGVEMETPVSKMTVSKTGDFYELCVPKSKMKFTKSNSFLYGCDLNLYRLSDMRVYRSRELSNFSPSCLSELALMGEGHPDEDILVFSFDEKKAHLLPYSTVGDPDGLISLSLTLASLLSEEKEMVKNVYYEFSDLSHSIFISDEGRCFRLRLNTHEIQ